MILNIDKMIWLTEMDQVNIARWNRLHSEHLCAEVADMTNNLLQYRAKLLAVETNYAKQVHAARVEAK
jgi:hypothetical protein